MDWFKPSLLVIAFISGLVHVLCDRAYSNTDVVRRYEQCVLNKLSRSQFFTEEDKLRMVKLVKETNNRMQLLHLDPTSPSNFRTILRLFAASLANIVADNLIPEKFQRKEDYLCAIELCSLSLPQLIADELIREVTRIFASMRNDKNLYVANGENAAQVSSRRRKQSSELPSEGNSLKLRYKRSPQAEILYAFTSEKQDEPLEAVISNLLINSPVFFNTFKAGIIRRNAISFATDMIGAALEDYDFQVVSESQTAATNAILMLSMNANTADYAFAITNGITSVLKTHQLAFLADGYEIGNALIQNLQNMQRADTSFSFLLPSFDVSRQTEMRSSAPINPGFEEIKQAAVNYPQNPSVTSPFQSNLEFLLSQSNILQNAFRYGFFEGLFGMVKAALSDYGFLISVAAANSITDLLASMAPNVVSNQYASVIAKTITNILYDNGFLQNADAWLLTGKMESKVNPNIGTKAASAQNQQDSQPFSFSFGDYQENPTFFSEFPTSEVEVPPILSPINPESVMNFGDVSGNPGYPTEFSDNIPETSQGTEILNKSPDIIPSFEFVIPGAPLPNFEGIEEKTLDSSFASKPTDQETDFSSVPRTDGSSAFPSETSYASMNMTSLNNYSMPDNGPEKVFSILSSPPDPGIPLEAGPSIPQAQQENVSLQIKGNINNTLTTLSQLEEVSSTTAGYDTSQLTTFTTPLTTTTATPYATSTIDSMSDSSKLAEDLIDDIFSAIRALNITPKTDKPSQMASNASSVDTTLSPLLLQSTTNDNTPPKDKLESISSVTAPVTLKSDTDGTSTVKIPSPELQPSFWPTAESASDDGSLAVKDSNNGAQSTKTEDEIEARDSKLIFTDYIVSAASSSIAFIRSGQVNLSELCRKLNELAPVVDIPPLDVCNELALVDYILNILKEATLILRHM